jgi:GNAT superfamily N-acetyltransferase
VAEADAGWEEVEDVTDRPAGWWEADVVISDGSTVHLRPILPTDHDRHERFVDQLSNESRYLRFMSARAHLTEAEIDHFCTVDYVDRMAIVATTGDDIVAVARYERTGDQVAEVAFVVADAMQGHGLGTLMLERLAEIALGNGIVRFEAEMLATNARMRQVFLDAGYATVLRYERGGTTHVDIDIRPSPGHEEAMQRRRAESERQARR